MAWPPDTSPPPFPGSCDGRTGSISRAGNHPKSGRWPRAAHYGRFAACARVGDSDAEGAPDDLLLDLGRAAVDGLDPGVEERLRDRVLEHVAVATVQLHATVDHL